MEHLAGVVGGLGLFIFGMRFLTENLKKLASRRLRQTVRRWTANRFAALLWGVFAGVVTQSMAALTFITVGVLRSRLLTMRGALATILGGRLGMTALVMIVTFDIKTVALCTVGVASAVMVAERLSNYRAVAASFLGGAMVVLGLVLLEEAAAPLADQPWFRDMVEGTGSSPALAFLVAALLAFAVQSTGAVSIVGISLATVGVISVDQAIMTIYGSFIGSGAVIYLLSANLTGRSRQLAMYVVILNALICAALVPLLYAELHLGVPSMKALVSATGLDPARQLALVYVVMALIPLPVMLAGLGLSVRVLERLWPVSEIDELSRTEFILPQVSSDAETSLMLADLEQKRAFGMLPRYFDLVRRNEDVGPLRDALRTVLSETGEFLTDLEVLHPMRAVEDRNALLNRQKLLSWLADAMAVMGAGLLGLGDRPVLQRFRSSLCEGVDGAFLAVADAMESGDRRSWDLANRLIDDRGELMGRIRSRYLESDPAAHRRDSANLMSITNTTEEIFFLLSKLVEDFDPYPRDEA